jgi:oxygen-independent coproporphyrinogen-3 oxidase
VPFCSAICNYCNFNRGLFDEALKTQFVAALLREIRALASQCTPLTLPPDTLYFGGGTPSLLTPAEVGSIVDEARRSFGLTVEAEVTLEANPESADLARLTGLREAGVNRLSFGVQSFRDDELARLGRLHSAAKAREALQLSRIAGFDNVSLDLMMWLPGQDLERWLASVEESVRVSPDHLSLYMLEVYPHLELRREMDRTGWKQGDEDVAADMYELAMTRLEEAGYQQYEISNVSRPGRESAHNLKYWTDGEWIGFGPGAHSTYQSERWRNVSTTEDYVRKVSAGDDVSVDRRRRSLEEKLGDALFTGLRLCRGIDLDALSARYGVDIWERFGARLTDYCQSGILLRKEGQLRLTRRGMLLANEVMSVFV